MVHEKLTADGILARQATTSSSSVGKKPGQQTILLTIMTRITGQELE
jgi:hypothetical protein